MSTPSKEILLGTQNPNKIAEIENILSDFPIKFRYLSEFTAVPKVEESGTSFAENARIKAESYFQRYKIPVLTEDSGLVVEALGGEPGIYSARYGSQHGEKANAQLLIQRVLTKMLTIPQHKRQAQFISVCILYIHEQQIHESTGKLDGFITYKSRGSHGFGYDPIFLLESLQKTLAQLSSAEKNALSHRAQAIRGLRDALGNFCAGDGVVGA